MYSNLCENDTERHGRRDRRTDRQTTCCGITALCVKISNKHCIELEYSSLRYETKSLQNQFLESTGDTTSLDIRYDTYYDACATQYEFIVVNGQTTTSAFHKVV